MGFWWRRAWVRVVQSIWFGTLASAGYVCGWSLVEKLLVWEGGLAVFLAPVDHVVEVRVEDAGEIDFWKGNEDVHVLCRMSGGVRVDLLVLPFFGSGVRGVGSE